MVLGWPNAANEMYLVQYRAALDANDPWADVTNYYPAALNTNWTTFVISNQICIQSGEIGQVIGGGGPPTPMVAISSAFARETLLLPPIPWDPSTWQFGAIATGPNPSDYVPITMDMVASVGGGIMHPEVDAVPVECNKLPDFGRLLLCRARRGSYFWFDQRGGFSAAMSISPSELGLDTMDEIVRHCFLRR